MKKNIRYVVVLLSLTSSFFAHAQEFSEIINDPNNFETYSELECCNQGCIYEGDCGSFTIGGDWLNWKVEQDRMQIAAIVTGIFEDDTSIISSEVIKPKFKYENGYRVFGNYITPNKCWALGASYTHSPAKGDVDAFVDLTLGNSFITLFSPNFPILTIISSGAFSSLTADWDGDINYLDIDLARRITISDRFQISPHVGIRGLWIDQKLEIIGVGTTDIPVPPFTSPLVFTTRMKLKMEGIGVEGGLWGSCYINYGFSIVGHFGGSLVYADVHNSSDLIATGVTTTTLSGKDRSHLSLPTVDTFIGLVFSHSCWNTLVNVHVGWEHHTIFDTNQYSTTGGSKMTLQGLTLGGSVTF